MATHNHRFSKQERLCSNEEIKTLFDNGRAFHEFPFTIVWQVDEAPRSNSPSRIAISVSKRRLRKAVQRNWVKRRTREAFRKNKWLLYDKLNQLGLCIKFIAIYTQKTEMEYAALHDRMVVVLNRFSAELEKYCKQDIDQNTVPKSTEQTNGAEHSKPTTAT